MGATRSRASRLAELAEELGANRAPYYVGVNDRPRQLRRAFPAAGWYWVPPGSHVAVYLAPRYDEARDQLVELLRREDDPE